jgi:shikimate kinase
MMDPLSGRRNRVFLTGFMGSGKSTIGPILANTIGYDYIDVDVTIEKKVGKTVNGIFRDLGEEYFRSVEQALISRLATKQRVVVSLGGGTIVDPVNFRTIIISGILIYLKANPEQLFKRLQCKTDRPVLTDFSGERLSEDRLRSRIQELYLKRELFYSKADITVLTDERKVGPTVDQIVRQLSAYIE